MQTLWTRVAQAGCRCPQCLASAPGTLARRSTTSAGRRPQYWTSSTLWYSGIFAAAATLDAKQKVQRREKWDQAIAEIKEELGHQDEQPTEQEAVKAKRIVKSQQVFEGEEAIRELEANLDSGRARELRPRWPTNTGAPLDERFLAPQSIYAPDSHKVKASSRRYNYRKMEFIMNRSDWLQLNIMDTIRRSEMIEEAADAVPPEYAALIRMPRPFILRSIFRKNEDYDRIVRTADEDCSPSQPIPSRGERLCSYHQDDQGHFRNVVSELNSTLRYLFERATSGTLLMPALLAKIAFNLQCSTAPPDLDTYNTLLVGFFNLSEHELFENTVHAMKGSHMRPNEVTLAAVLGYNTTIGDFENFRHWVALMRGSVKSKPRAWSSLDQEYRLGLMEARPDIMITDDNHTRLVRDEASGRVIQRPHASPIVFGALVKGILKFSGFDVALGIVHSMAEEGWGLCMKGMAPLLHDCALRGDWAAGLSVWKQLQALKTKSRERVGRQWSEEKVPPTAFADMLKLTSSCRQREIFDDVLQQAEQTHPYNMDQILYWATSPDDRPERMELPRARGERPASDPGQGHANSPYLDPNYEEKEVSVESQSRSDVNVAFPQLVEGRDSDSRLKIRYGGVLPLKSSTTTRIESGV
ncbi:Hypothetical predicted protein [Lecanosticta acicola]|uniref:Pentatricopeptide repeat protein n=1 Tax=Lecanosticta acicola TaxID=111012 RepID=A0AAI8Z0V8_9PEZI|nr:Hypothetical predicted protein [Lecanosticta acicola]